MTTSSAHEILEVGDRAPAFELRSAEGQAVGGGEFLGRWLLVLFYPSLEPEHAVAEVRALQDLAGEFERLGVKVFVITRESDPARVTGGGAAFPILRDGHGRLFGVFGVGTGEADAGEGDQSRVHFLLDPSLRVVARQSGQPSGEQGERILADAQSLVAAEEPRHILSHAPVLIVPNVLPPEACRRLIEVWETQGNEDSGSMIQRDGQTIPVYNYDHKIRRDHFMKAGPDEERIKRYIGRRVLPEVRMAFNYNVTRREDFRIACYDSGRGGYFRPHRDNTTEGTAHRRFAMSLLLNDDYEGGYVRFPEYGQHRYRPRAGGAVIFSCSLLHEATDVTAGRRFVLLSFLYGEAEAKIREEYNRKSGGVYRA
jgi:peroxiredoxin